MTLAFISTMRGHRWGGSEELWFQAALRLARTGHRVAVYGERDLTPPADGFGQLRLAGGTVHFPDPPPALWRRVLAKAGWRRLTSSFSLREPGWLRALKPDLVCISQGGAFDGLGWMQTCHRLRLPFVTVAQANAEMLWPWDSQAASLLAVVKASRRCFFVSRRNQQLMEDQLGTDLENTEVVSNPVNVPFDANPPWPDDSRGLRLACVARLEPLAKGQDLLLRVLSRPEWRERDLRVSFFGSGGCEAGVKRLVARLQLTSVDLPGFATDVVGIWAGHHALVLPSRYEGLPLSLVEACLCRRPAIVTDVGGNAELVEDGVTGFVAPAPTVDLVAAALERAWNERSRWREMGLAARARVEREFPRDPVGVFCDRLLAVSRG